MYMDRLAEQLYPKIQRGHVDLEYDFTLFADTFKLHERTARKLQEMLTWAECWAISYRMKWSKDVYEVQGSKNPK